MKRSRYLLVILPLLYVSFAVFALHAQTKIFPNPLSSRIANYDIEVKLDTENRMLTGKETLRWKNETSSSTNELQFHLYLNAFRNNQSTFMKESGGVSRRNKIDKNGWGFSEVESIRLADGTELKDRMEFIHPDDDNEADKTVFRIPLGRNLLPGQEIELHIDFTAKLPSPPFTRTGAKKEYFFAGQWFPKVGVFQNGTWNCHQFHANSEFFADFGVYNVWITVPTENIVGATGLEVEARENDDGTTTHYYHAEDVHDFAWTTSPEFVVVTGKEQNVDIRILMQQDHVGQSQRHLKAAQVAIKYFHDWYGNYPFPNLTVVDPRRGAGGSGGMEYPTLITAGTTYGLPQGIRGVEIVIIHEFGHNYWYHLIASNEFEESWLDEGINTYSEIQIVDDQYGPKGGAIDFLGIKINDLQYQRGQYLFFPDLDPIVKAAWKFYSGTSYGINSYAKPGVVLTTLQNYLGKDTILHVMQTYFERWKFKHPTTQDFIDAANDAAGQNLDWYFSQALFTNAVLDYSVANVFTRKVKKPKGFDYTLTVADSLIADSAKGLETDSAEINAEEDMYYSGVNVRRLGDFQFPVDVDVVFANGDTIREHWDGKSLWKKYRYTKPVKLISAEIDPDHKIPLDVNITNNSRSVKRQSIGINKLSIRFLFWIQFLLDQPAIVNLFSGFSALF